MLTTSAVLFHNAFLLNDYIQTSSNLKTKVLIESGDTGTDIAKKLYQSGVIKVTKVFIKIAINQKKSNSISPGVHEIDLKISAQAALDQLLDPTRKLGVFGFVEGLRKTEILTLLEKSNLVTGKLSRSSTRSSKLDKGYLNYSPYQLLIIASMVQAEGDTQDFAKISRVIYNRMKIGMPLQINATIDYVTNTRGKIRLPYKRLEIDSKYNTYKYRGLPPTPISNPGEDAMIATVNPENGDWLYYVTVKPNDTRFTKDFNEFNKWANEFRANEDAGLFG